MTLLSRILLIGSKMMWSTLARCTDLAVNPMCINTGGGGRAAAAPQAAGGAYCDQHSTAVHRLPLLGRQRAVPHPGQSVSVKSECMSEFRSECDCEEVAPRCIAFRS